MTLRDKKLKDDMERTLKEIEYVDIDEEITEAMGKERKAQLTHGQRSHLKLYRIISRMKTEIKELREIVESYSLMVREVEDSVRYIKNRDTNRDSRNPTLSTFEGMLGGTDGD